MEQAADAFQRAEEREERERLAAELSQVSAQVQKLSSDRNHLQWCLEKERARDLACAQERGGGGKGKGGGVKGGSGLSVSS